MSLGALTSHLPINPDIFCQIGLLISPSPTSPLMALPKETQSWLPNLTHGLLYIHLVNMRLILASS